MTEAEKRTLFAGVQPATRAAIRLDGNEQLFEKAWLASDFDEFIRALEVFAISLGCTTLRLHAGRGPKVTDRIAADVKTVCERAGWSWVMQRVEVRGRA